MTTAERMRKMPIPESIVNASEKYVMPTIVATMGSTVARMPALLASTLRRPSVYKRNGITAVNSAVIRLNKMSPLKSVALEYLDNISTGWQMNQEPIAAIKNVYVVTV